MNFLHLSGESTESFIRKADMAARQCEFWQKAPFFPLFLYYRSGDEKCLRFLRPNNEREFEGLRFGG